MQYRQEIIMVELTKLARLFTLTLAASLFSAGAHAAVIYKVTDTSRVNCAGAPHGLWTNTDMGSPSCNANYFSIQEGTTLTVDGDHAELKGSAKNPNGVLAYIDLKFSDHVETYNYKKEGGIAWSPLDDTPDIDFFTQVLGTITIDNDIYKIDGFAGGFGFQYGMGANAKRPDEFGGSSWITSSIGCQEKSIYSCMTSHHWDLNVNLHAVSEGGTVGMLTLGLAALGAVRRSKRAGPRGASAAIPV